MVCPNYIKTLNQRSFFLMLAYTQGLFSTILYHMILSICRVRKTAASVPSVLAARPCVNAAGVSRHRHHMLPPTNRLQSHLTVNHWLHALPIAYIQDMTSDSSQGLDEGNCSVCAVTIICRSAIHCYLSKSQFKKN